MEEPSVPSPQCEAVANDLQELSLQSGSNVQTPVHRPKTPPLSERKNVLQLKLQQRRTREELVNQGIMPPLKSPASFHEQRRSLERALTEDYLKHKIRCRPERSELVRMHILEETSAEPSLQAKQLKLKRARLADDLNEKISQRPGPMELVVKNILPVETSLKEAIIDVDYAKVADSSSFDDDSSDTLSPEQPPSQDSQGSVQSPVDSRASESAMVLSPAQTVTWVQLATDPPERSPITPLNINGVSFPALVKHSQSKLFNEKSQRKKSKEANKPKVKKLKYHQYIPPDQKQNGAAEIEDSYAKILQQQQLFLQLQILNQHQHYNYQTILPAPAKKLPEQQAIAISSTTTVRTIPTVTISTHSTPTVVRQNSNVAAGAVKIGPLPHNLDDLKVAELKQELKQRGLHVSGTKVDLIERLKATQDACSASSALAKSAPIQQPKSKELASAIELTNMGSSISTPCSPCLSEVSMASMDEISTAGYSFGEMVSSPVTQLLILSSPATVSEKCSIDVQDKDIILREKDKQIEELTRRLKQKQELVEKLRQQLEQEKNIQQLQICDKWIIQMKQDPGSDTCNLVTKSGAPELSTTVKSEFITSAPCQPEQKNSASKVDERKMCDSSEAQIVFPVSSPTTILLDDNQAGLLKVDSPKTPPPQPELEPPSQSIFTCLSPTKKQTKKSPGLVEFLGHESNTSENGQLMGKQLDDFFDKFIHNLGLVTECKEFLVPSLKQTSPPHAINVRPHTEIPAPPSPTPSAPNQLKDFLETSSGAQLLQGEQDGTSSAPLIDDQHSQMLSSLAILDPPSSPIDTSYLTFSTGGDPLGLDMAESSFDSMDWLELSGPPAMNLTPLSTATPSVFSTDFLDSHDLQLHWDPCL